MKKQTQFSLAIFYIRFLFSSRLFYLILFSLWDVWSIIYFNYLSIPSHHLSILSGFLSFLSIFPSPITYLSLSLHVSPFLLKQKQKHAARKGRWHPHWENLCCKLVPGGFVRTPGPSILALFLRSLIRDLFFHPALTCLFYAYIIFLSAWLIVWLLLACLLAWLSLFMVVLLFVFLVCLILLSKLFLFTLAT